jgi:hypothetical protein
MTWENGRPRQKFSQTILPVYKQGKLETVIHTSIASQLFCDWLEHRGPRKGPENLNNLSHLPFPPFPNPTASCPTEICLWYKFFFQPEDRTRVHKHAEQVPHLSCSPSVSASYHSLSKISEILKVPSDPQHYFQNIIWTSFLSFINQQQKSHQEFFW